MEVSALKDASFLKKLDKENLKTFYVKIIVLDKEEHPLRAIEGRVSAGSISIDGSSAVRRSGSITFLAEETENDLTDVDNLLSMNKKITILIGIENNIDDNYDKIIWFKQGIFIITSPNISHNAQGVTINLQFKDKMCLLNGDCGGGLPASVTFDSYDQVVGYQKITSKKAGTKIEDNFPDSPNNYTVYGWEEDGNISYYMWDTSKGWYPSNESMIGSVISVPQRFFDIIGTLVCNYGGEAWTKIIIEDVPLEIKNSVRYVGVNELYYNLKTQAYTEDSEAATSEDWIVFKMNDDCGYIYTDFTYPGKLVSSIGENVCSVLDKIKQSLGNYEYFYDIDGNFVFREIKNNLNTQYDPVQPVDREWTLATPHAGQQYSFLLSEENYFVDFSNYSQSVYTFEDGSTLISAYTNAPNYLNIKNDFHIWGKTSDGMVIHYHIAIKEKPIDFGTYNIIEEIDTTGNFTGRIRLSKENEEGKKYIPTDWRAELYMRGLEKQSRQQRPDIYEQELLDLFDAIYDMRQKCYKADIVNHPNDLKYWFDYIEPNGKMYDISVDAIGPRIHSYQQDKIRKLYDVDIPQIVMIDINSPIISRESLKKKCENESQAYSFVPSSVYRNLALGTIGYSAKEVARDLLYRFTDYTAAINLTSIPIYYINPNSRITVNDRAAGIFGDYVIKTINLPLDAKNTMTISATRALERI